MYRTVLIASMASNNRASVYGGGMRSVERGRTRIDRHRDRRNHYHGRRRHRRRNETSAATSDASIWHISRNRLSSIGYPVYCYIFMGILLFVTGILTTAVVLGDGIKDVSMYSQAWLVGPLLICSSVLVFIKTYVYVRRTKKQQQQQGARNVRGVGIGKWINYWYFRMRLV